MTWFDRLNITAPILNFQFFNSRKVAIIKKVRGFEPKMGENCFLADNAVVVGDVTMGEGCSIWFGAVLRGDVNTITIGDRVNIQDNAVIHTL